MEGQALGVKWRMVQGVPWRTVRTENLRVVAQRAVMGEIRLHLDRQAGVPAPERWVLKIYAGAFRPVVSRHRTLKEGQIRAAAWLRQK